MKTDTDSYIDAYCRDQSIMIHCEFCSKNQFIGNPEKCVFQPIQAPMEMHDEDAIDCSIAQPCPPSVTRSLLKALRQIRIEGARSVFRFSYAQGNNDYEQIREVSARYLSSVTIGGFTGTYIGLYATGNGKPSGAGADYDWFEYSDNRVDPSSHLF